MMDYWLNVPLANSISNSKDISHSMSRSTSQPSFIKQAFSIPSSKKTLTSIFTSSKQSNKPHNNNKSIKYGQIIKQRVGFNKQTMLIPQERKIIYIPFHRKYQQYQNVDRISKIPIQKQIIQYHEIKHKQKVPRERLMTDYFAVQHQKEYIKRQTIQTIRQLLPVQKYSKRIQYIPFETKIIHFPQDKGLEYKKQSKRSFSYFKPVNRKPQVCITKNTQASNIHNLSRSGETIQYKQNNSKIFNTKQALSSRLKTQSNIIEEYSRFKNMLHPQEEIQFNHNNFNQKSFSRSLTTSNIFSIYK